MISIIIPTRNRTEFLVRAVNSVLSQSHGNFELIIADNSDYRSDFVADLDRIEDHPGRIRYIPPTGYLPMADNWQRGYLQARGDYLLFLPDKAVLAPNALMALIAQGLSPEWIYTWEISHGLTAKPARVECNSRSFSREEVFHHVEVHAELSQVFPHGMNALYPRRSLCDWSMKTSCPDYNSGGVAVWRPGMKGVKHLPQALTYVPRSNPIHTSTGAMVALSHKGAEEYLNDTLTEIPEDPTYCWGYVERVLGLPFNLPAYLRHTLHRLRNHQPVDFQLEMISRHKRRLIPAVVPTRPISSARSGRTSPSRRPEGFPISLSCGTRVDSLARIPIFPKVMSNKSSTSPRATAASPKVRSSGAVTTLPVRPVQVTYTPQDRVAIQEALRGNSVYFRRSN